MEINPKITAANAVLYNAGFSSWQYWSSDNWMAPTIHHAKSNKQIKQIRAIDMIAVQPQNTVPVVT